MRGAGEGASQVSQPDRPHGHHLEIHLKTHRLGTLLLLPLGPELQRLPLQLLLGPDLQLQPPLLLLELGRLLLDSGPAFHCRLAGPGFGMLRVWDAQGLGCSGSRVLRV